MTATLDRPATSLAEMPHRLVPRPLFLLFDMDAHALWRTRWICDELNRRGYVADYCYLRDIDSVAGLIQAGRFNLAVTPRLIFTDAEHQCPEFQELVHSDGLTWVYEADDEIFSPDIVEHQLVCFDLCRQAGRAQLEHERLQRIKMAQAADAVIVSTPALAGVLGRYTESPIHVVPNAVDVPWFLARTHGVARQLPTPTVGWAGGARRSADLEPVAKAWARIAKRYPEVTFVVFGERMPILMDAIPKGEHRRVYIPWVDLDLYPRGLPHIDIACCSVADTPWNACKSPDKYFEHTLAGGACIVSPALYGRIVTHEHDALVAETADEWEAAIARLIDDPTLRWQLNTGALETVAHQYSTQRTWQDWVAALSAILAQSNGSSGRQSNAARAFT